MTLPIDRTAKAALDLNLVNGILSDAPKIKANNDVVYNTIDELNAKVNTNYASGAVGTTQLADGSVTTAKHADGSVTTAKIADSAVTLTKMADSSVGTTELVDLAVTNGKVADATLTAAKFVTGALTNETQNALRITDLETDVEQREINVKSPPAPLVAAVGDGVVDDTASITAILAYAASFSNVSATVLFPYGIYCVSSHIYLPATFGKVNSINKIVGRGAVIKSTSSTADFIFIGQEVPTGNQQNIYIDGIVFDGNYLSGGIKLNGVNVWEVAKCKFINCIVGLQISDSYYGEIGNESTFIENLTAIKFTTGATVENNTIQISNVRISGLSDTTAFGAPGMSVVGITLNSAISAVKFDGVIIENVDYGMLGYDLSSYGSTNGGLNGVFTIKECYFEAIREKAIAFGIVTVSGVVITVAKNNASAGKYNIMPTVSILGCRFVSNGNEVEISSGIYYIRGNDGIVINILSSSDYSLFLDSDMRKEDITWDAVNSINILTYKNPKITIDGEYANYGQSLSSRLQSIGFLKTQENREFTLAQDTILFNKLSRFTNVRNITTGNVAFLAQESRPNGAIVNTNSGKYTMLQVKDDLTVVAKQVFNAGLVTNSYGVYLPHEIYKIQSTKAVGDVVNVIGIHKTFGAVEPFTLSAAKELTGDASGFTGLMIRIGTAKRIFQQTIPSSNNNITFYDPAIDKYYSSYLGTLVYAGDYLGIDQTVIDQHITAIGALAARPAAPAVESTFYATDTNLYYIYRSGAWTTLTPLFAIV